MNDAVIEISNLTRRFGSKKALDDVSLSVPAGIVMGLVGENGAGKTTLIKHILGLLRAQTGSVRVFGKDPVLEPESVLSQIGYLSEEGDLPLWMRVHELMRYAAGFYPTWDENYARQLLQEFNLDASAKLSRLSKGQRSRAGLLVAMAYRPKLLLLDEPSSGLDPIVRRDILGAIIRTIADDGRTVLFSSHLLTEVERVSDRIAIVKSGRILLSDSLENVMERHLRVTLVFDEPRATAPEIEGSLGWTGSGREWSTTFCGQVGHLEASAAVLGARIVDRNALSLDEIFVAQVGAA
ncbi:MAG TPA: ABC transporter ATP-binding protein [Fimbriimonadaceae bacterium]|nr:ABC transporter ATP-binding protein [Fimbriimonadaceae bacterium]